MADTVIAGRYRLGRRIGAGGMSEVWSATDLDLERNVAVKLLATDADPARFEREARAAAGLAHPNVCTLYAYGADGGRRYMVLELLPGGSLEDRLAGGRPLPDEDTRRIATEIAAGLAHAHQRGVVHRDLKPANILFDSEGRAKIADFGIARTEAATGLTQAGTVLGTAAYISPEQARGETATPASDVYAFGVILFRMLSGRLPFEAPDALTLAAMHRDLQAPPLTEFRPDAPPLLESVAGAALAKSPSDRPEDGAALLDELRHAGEATTAVTQIVAPPGRRRTRLLFALAAGAAAVAGVGLAIALTLDDDTSPPPVPTSLAATTTSTSSPVGAPPASETTAPETTAPATSSTRAATTTEVTSTAGATTGPPETRPTTAPSTTVPATTVAPPPPSTTTGQTTTASATTVTSSATTATTTTGPVTTSPVTTEAPPAAQG